MIHPSKQGLSNTGISRVFSPKMCLCDVNMVMCARNAWMGGWVVDSEIIIIITNCMSVFLFQGFYEKK